MAPIVQQQIRPATSPLVPRNAAHQMLGDAPGPHPRTPVMPHHIPHGAPRPGVLRAGRETGVTPEQCSVAAHVWRPRMAAVGIAEHLVRGITRNQRRGRGSNLLMHDGGHRRIGVDRSRSIEAVRLILDKYPPGATRYVTVDAWA